MATVKLKKPLGEARQSLEVEVDGVKYIELSHPVVYGALDELVGLGGLDVLIDNYGRSVPKIYSSLVETRNYGHMKHRYELKWFDGTIARGLWNDMFQSDGVSPGIRILFRSDQLIDPEPPAIEWWELPRGSVVLDDEGMQWVVTGTGSATGVNLRKIVRLSDGVQVHDTIAIDPASYSAPFGGWPNHYKVKIVRVLEVADRA